MSTYTGGRSLALILRLLLSLSEPPSDFSSSELEEALVEGGSRPALSLTWVPSGEVYPNMNPVFLIINLNKAVTLWKLAAYLDFGLSSSNEASPLFTLLNIAVRSRVAPLDCTNALCLFIDDFDCLFAVVFYFNSIFVIILIMLFCKVLIGWIKFKYSQLFYPI